MGLSHGLRSLTSLFEDVLPHLLHIFPEHNEDSTSSPLVQEITKSCLSNIDNMRKMAGHIAIVHVLFEFDAAVEFEVMIHDMSNRQEARLDVMRIDT